MLHCTGAMLCCNLSTRDRPPHQCAHLLIELSESEMVPLMGHPTALPPLAMFYRPEIRPGIV